MSDKQIRDTILEALESFAEIPIAYENATFNADGLAAYYGFTFDPVEDVSLGKTANDSDDAIGFCSINVYVRKDADDYDNQQLELIDKLKSVFYSSANLDGVYITSNNSSSTRFDGGWCIRTLTVNYSSYVTRISA